MAFKRKGSAKYHFQARTQRGWIRLSSGTDQKALANSIEKMWHDLAVGNRAWDVLTPVLEKRLAIGVLYDRWLKTKHDVSAVRAGLREEAEQEAEIDLATLVPGFNEVYSLRKPKSARKVVQRLRWLIPVGGTLPKSVATRSYLRERLYAYRDEHNQPVCANTLRRVHSAWSVFFAHLVEGEVLETNPMEALKKPSEEVPPIQFHDEATAQKIVAAAETAELRALLALAYGAAIEVGVLVKLCRKDMWDQDQAVYAAGTKAHRRQRVSVVADWAWPYVQQVIRSKLPGARLFPDAWAEHPDRLTKMHAGIQKALKLPVYTLHHSRHSWAATRLRDGWPIADIQTQLGHSTPMLTLKTYGAFVSDVARRRKMESERQNRKAVGQPLGQ